MTKLHEDTLAELWESIEEEYSYGVEPELVNISGYVSEHCLGYSTKEEMTFEMVIEGTIRGPIKKDNDIASLKAVKVIVVPNKKEDEVMEDRLYKFSEIIQMLEEGELPEGTKIAGKDYNKSLNVYGGREGSSIEWQDGSYLHLNSGLVNSLYKIEKSSAKRYKAFHKVFVDYHGEPFLLFQRGNNSIALLDNTGSGNYKNTFIMEELEAFPINLNDFNLEEVSTDV